ncbi:hypothetical protein ACSLBF_12385 [Pseudoalteromonas sp. T1lg65]|uniref:hypothetical protein n=1 Tax=Pseudoalteromonas sp. T1lg65 TaxID=2077101 RepID=UPI003F79B55D
MSELLTAIDWAVISSKFVALITLLFFAKQSVKKMLFGIPSDDWREQVEHSLLIVALLSFLFHFLGRGISEVLLSADIDAGAKRQLYYLFFAFYEVLYVASIVKLHIIKRCVFAKYSRYVCYLSGAMTLVLMARYVDRVVLEMNILASAFMYSVALINVATLLVISTYPACRLLNFVPNKRWV